MIHLTCEKQFQDEIKNIRYIRYVRQMLFYFEQYVRYVRMLLFIMYIFVKSKLTEYYLELLLRVELIYNLKKSHAYIVGGVLS